MTPTRRKLADEERRISAVRACLDLLDQARREAEEETREEARRDLEAAKRGA